MKTSIPPWHVLPDDYYRWPEQKCSNRSHEVFRFDYSPTAPQSGMHYCGCYECRTRWSYDTSD